MFTIDRIQREVQRLVFTFTPKSVSGHVVTGITSSPQVEVIPVRTIPTRRAYATESAASVARDALLKSRRWGNDELVVRPVSRHPPQES